MKTLDQLQNAYSTLQTKWRAMIQVTNHYAEYMYLQGRMDEIDLEMTRLETESQWPTRTTTHR